MKFSYAALLATAVLSAPLAQADNSEFYRNTAQSILNTLQTKASSLTSDEQAALELLNSKRDRPETAPSHIAAEQLLENSFSALFIQADNVELPIQTTETIFGRARDVSTFCPPGSTVGRHLATEYSPFDEKIERYWGWSHCTAADSSRVEAAVRIQEIWVSNVKHPVLTLQIVADEQPGMKTHLDLDINKLIAGNIPESEIFRAISPKKP